MVKNGRSRTLESNSSKEFFINVKDSDPLEPLFFLHSWSDLNLSEDKSNSQV